MPAEQVITRRNLPHGYVPGAVHFVTYRLAGTIPTHVLDAWRQEFDRSLGKSDDAPRRHLAHKRYYKRFDEYLEPGGHGETWLSSPPVAALIRSNLYHHDGSLYHLIAYCVMPNHVHVLMQPREVWQARQAEDESVPGERPDDKGP